MYVPKTKAHKTDIGTFKMLLGVPMRVNLCSAVTQARDVSGTLAGNSFLIVEGYMYDFEADGDSDIAEYIKARADVIGLEARFELFCLVVDFERHELLEEVYHRTRENALKVPPASNEGEKKDELNQSKKS